MSGPFKNQVKKHFNEKSLSSEQMQNLDALQKKMNTPQKRKAPSWTHFAVGAVFAIVTLLGYGITVWNGTYKAAPMKQIVNEITYNHLKQMPTEIETNSLAEAQKFLAQLDFSMIQSAKLPSDTWELVGARYCTIYGKRAAQLKVKNKQNNQLYTFYQFPAPASLGSIEGEVYKVKVGTEVRVWREGNLILGLAGAEPR